MKSIDLDGKSYTYSWDSNQSGYTDDEGNERKSDYQEVRENLTKIEGAYKQSLTLLQLQA